MKKSVSLLITALILCTALSVPAFAAEEAAPGKNSCYYPISVEEYTYGPLDELRIDKVYQLSLDDDPGGIPTEDFTRGGRLYYLLDMTKKDEVGVDTKTYVHTITQASDTNNMEAVLRQLDAELEVTTEDGYTGTLMPDYPGITVEAKGYKTSSRTVTATRSYPNLSDADTSLIPRTVQDGGRTLTLADVQWQEAGGFYNATATYSGTASSKYATGYIATVEYKGEVTRTSCDTVLYTATFARQGETQIKTDPQPTQTPAGPDGPEDSAGFDLRWLIILPVLAAMVGLAFGGRFLYKYVKSKKEWKEYTK